MAKCASLIVDMRSIEAIGITCLSSPIKGIKDIVDQG